MDNNKNSFSYSYSAERQKEIQGIVSKYVDCTEDKYQQLKKLDEEVESSATAICIFYAIVSVLVFGTGLSICLAFERLIIGSIVVIAGVAMLFYISAVRKRVLKIKRNRVRAKILKLAEEINEMK